MYLGTSLLFWSRNSHKPENLLAEGIFFYFYFLTAFLLLSRARRRTRRLASLRHRDGRTDGRTDGPKSSLLFSWRRYLGEVPISGRSFSIQYCSLIWCFKFQPRIVPRDQRPRIWVPMGLTGRLCRVCARFSSGVCMCSLGCCWF